MSKTVYLGMTADIMHPGLINEEFYKLKYCSTVVYMVPRA